MKRFSKTMLAGVVLTVTSLVTLMASPAGAFEGGGVVNGTVRVTSSTSPGGGIGPNPATTTYDFESIVLNGAFHQGNSTFAGNISVNNVRGGSNPLAESSVSGQGYVDLFTVDADPLPGMDDFSGSCSGYDGVDSNNNPNHGSAFSTTGGGYDRVGTIVLVKLECQGQVGADAVPLTNVFVVAQFTPTETGGGTPPDVTAATFSGTFEAGVELF